MIPTNIIKYVILTWEFVKGGVSSSGEVLAGLTLMSFLKTFPLTFVIRPNEKNITNGTYFQKKEKKSSPPPFTPKKCHYFCHFLPQKWFPPPTLKSCAKKRTNDFPHMNICYCTYIRKLKFQASAPRVHKNKLYRKILKYAIFWQFFRLFANMTLFDTFNVVTLGPQRGSHKFKTHWSDFKSLSKIISALILLWIFAYFISCNNETLENRDRTFRNMLIMEHHLRLANTWF